MWSIMLVCFNCVYHCIPYPTSDNHDIVLYGFFLAASLFQCSDMAPQFVARILRCQIKNGKMQEQFIDLLHVQS